MIKDGLVSRLDVFFKLSGHFYWSTMLVSLSNFNCFTISVWSSRFTIQCFLRGLTSKLWLRYRLLRQRTRGRDEPSLHNSRFLNRPFHLIIEWYCFGCWRPLWFTTNWSELFNRLLYLSLNCALSPSRSSRPYLLAWRGCKILRWNYSYLLIIVFLLI